ncbi:unnamed protein product [Orchesella dallaii]|uniref:Uncharacterized protein n=1 Tax=Orchesella dallaii TaxID=48710 RepID=A0ABP1RRP4_9HEXA
MLKDDLFVVLPSKRRCSASSENTHVIDLTQAENTPPKKRRILRKEEYTDEMPWPSNYETNGNQDSEDDGVLIRIDDTCMISLRIWWRPLTKALIQSFLKRKASETVKTSKKFQTSRMTIFKSLGFASTIILHHLSSTMYPPPFILHPNPHDKYCPKLAIVTLKCPSTYLAAYLLPIIIPDNQNSTDVWWKSRFTARVPKNVLVPIARDLRTIQPRALLDENPYF